MKIYLKTQDFAVSGENFDLIVHDKWEMLVTAPRPADLDHYYDSSEYISHSDDSKGFVNFIYQMVKRVAMRQKVRWIRKYAETGSKALDIGAGTADFVLALRHNGWQAEGVEPNDLARSKALSKGVALNRSLAEVSDKYQVITLWHVLEHLPDLEESISQILSRLLPGGTLILALPNYCSLDARHYGRHWAAYDVPRHLWHFSQNAISSMFKEKGYKVVKTYPMFFDAYYISILSERYRGTRFKFLKAFYQGSRSNISALRSGEYSSLAYVLQRQ